MGERRTAGGWTRPIRARGLEGARITWEALRKVNDGDLEANTLLGTIYQRLGDLTRSDLAVRRALGGKDLRPHARAELQSLIGRNAKAAWLQQWRKEGLDGQTRRATALLSPSLAESSKAYEEGFRDDLNHFYSGVNALAMLTIEIELTKGLPQAWEDQFPDADEADRAMKARRKHAERLAAAVDSLAGRVKAIGTLRNVGHMDSHQRSRSAVVNAGQAAIRRPGYRRALAGAESFARNAACDQLMIYQDLGLLPESVAAALQVFDRPAEKKKAATPERIILFTGHRIDAADRKKPRFPPDKEGVAREAIKNAVAAEMTQPDWMRSVSRGEPVAAIFCSMKSAPNRAFRRNSCSAFPGRTCR